MPKVADATLTLTKATFESIQLGQLTVENAIAAGDLHIDGRQEAFMEFLGIPFQLPNKVAMPPVLGS